MRKQIFKANASYFLTLPLFEPIINILQFPLSFTHGQQQQYRSMCIALNSQRQLGYICMCGDSVLDVIDLEDHPMQRKQFAFASEAEQQKSDEGVAFVQIVDNVLFFVKSDYVYIHHLRNNKHRRVKFGFRPVNPKISIVKWCQNEYVVSILHVEPQSPDTLNHHLLKVRISKQISVDSDQENLSKQRFEQYKISNIAAISGDRKVHFCVQLRNSKGSEELRIGVCEIEVRIAQRQHQTTVFSTEWKIVRPPKQLASEFLQLENEQNNQQSEWQNWHTQLSIAHSEVLTIVFKRGSGKILVMINSTKQFSVIWYSSGVESVLLDATRLCVLSTDSEIMVFAVDGSSNPVLRKLLLGQYDSLRKLEPQSSRWSAKFPSQQKSVQSSRIYAKNERDLLVVTGKMELFETTVLFLHQKPEDLTRSLLSMQESFHLAGQIPPLQDQNFDDLICCSSEDQEVDLLKLIAIHVQPATYKATQFFDQHQLELLSIVMKSLRNYMPKIVGRPYDCELNSYYWSLVSIFHSDQHKISRDLNFVLDRLLEQTREECKFLPTILVWFQFKQWLFRKCKGSKQQPECRVPLLVCKKMQGCRCVFRRLMFSFEQVMEQNSKFQNNSKNIFTKILWLVMISQKLQNQSYLLTERLEKKVKSQEYQLINKIGLKVQINFRQIKKLSAIPQLPIVQFNFPVIGPPNSIVSQQIFYCIQNFQFKCSDFQTKDNLQNELAKALFYYKQLLVECNKIWKAHKKNALCAIIFTFCSLGRAGNIIACRSAEKKIYLMKVVKGTLEYYQEEQLVQFLREAYRKTWSMVLESLTWALCVKYEDQSLFQIHRSVVSLGDGSKKLSLLSLQVEQVYSKKTLAAEQMRSLTECILRVVIRKPIQKFSLGYFRNKQKYLSNNNLWKYVIRSLLNIYANSLIQKIENAPIER